MARHGSANRGPDTLGIPVPRPVLDLGSSGRHNRGGVRAGRPMARPRAVGGPDADLTRGRTPTPEDVMPHAIQTPAAHATEYDAIVATMRHYIEGGRAGQSSLMRPGFLPDATMVGYAGGTL